MSAAEPRREIRSAILLGILDAAKSHRRMFELSRRGFANAPEYLVTTRIADRLARRFKGCGVELEMSIGQALKLANATQKGRRPGNLNGAKRFDVVLWWKSKKKPRAIVEVKHGIRGFGPLEPDVLRICEALQRNSEFNSFQCGFVAFLLHTAKELSSESEAKRHLEKAIEKLDEQVRAFQNGRGKKYSHKIKVVSRGPILRDVGETKTRWGIACCISVFTSRSRSS